MKVLVLSSGGVDSTTAIGLAIDRYGKENVISLSIYYGQKHERELEAAAKIAAYYEIEHLELNLTKIFEYSDCSLLKHSSHEYLMKAMESRLKKLEALLLFQPTFLSVMECFFPVRQVLL